MVCISACLAVVRAMWSCAAVMDPPGRMNVFCGVRCCVVWSMSVSNVWTSWLVMRIIFAAGACAFRGVARSAPSEKSSACRVYSVVLRVLCGDCAMANPMCALV